MILPPVYNLPDFVKGHGLASPVVTKTDLNRTCFLRELLLICDSKLLLTYLLVQQLLMVLLNSILMECSDVTLHAERVPRQGKERE